MAQNLSKTKLIHEILAEQKQNILGKASVAPSDGKQYAMKDGEWVEVITGGSFSGNLDDVPDGTTYKRVTQTEENTWNAKSDLTLSTVKADTDIASAISLKHSNSLDHSHSNKTTLDNVQEALTSLLKNNYDTAYSNTHTHSNKVTLDSVQEALTTALKSNYDTAYSHSQSAHAPSNAQKNSDILKSEIEAVLTGEISSHSHAGGGGGLTQPQIMARSLGC